MSSTLKGAIAQNGVEIVGLSLNASTELQYTAYRIKATSCTLAGHAGTYTSAFQALASPYGSAIITRQWSFNKSGSGTGSFVRNFSGYITTGTSTATDSVNSDCTYTSTITNSDGVVSHVFGVTGIGQNDVETLSMQIDSGWVSLATAYGK